MTNSDDQSLNIYLACDGFGEDLKNSVKSYIIQKEQDNIKIQDLGCDTYFDSAAKVAKLLMKQNKEIQNNFNNDCQHDPIYPSHIGILFCGTGMGVSIVANKFPQVRAAVCENTLAARYARAINDANVLCLGEMITDKQTANLIVDDFLAQKFISRPTNQAGVSVEWWNEEVENFLKTSSKCIKEIETNINN